jgi:hypothetical protein
MARYFVVFMDLAAYPDSDLYGRFVAHDGGLIGGAFAVVTDTADQAFPSVAFNPHLGRFLVTWEDDVLADYDATAREVLSDGTLLDDPFLLSPFYGDQKNPAVVYNEYSREYLVLWQDWRYGSPADIFGQAVSGDGRLLGHNTPINDDRVPCTMPAACARTSSGEYLAVWAAYYNPDYDIMGQILY